MSDSSILPGGQRVERTRTGKGVGFGRSVAFSAARGAALIGLAVIIGIVLLQVIDDGTSGPIGDGGGGERGWHDGHHRRHGLGLRLGIDVHHDRGHAGEATRGGCGARAQRVGPSGRGHRAEQRAEGEGLPDPHPGRRPEAHWQHRVLQAGLRPRVHDGRGSVDGAPKVEAMPSPAPTGSENASCVVILGT